MIGTINTWSPVVASFSGGLDILISSAGALVIGLVIAIVAGLLVAYFVVQNEVKKQTTQMAANGRTYQKSKTEINQSRDDYVRTEKKDVRHDD